MSHLPVAPTDADCKPHALTIKEDLEFEKWADIGKHLKTIRRSIDFWVGDWASHGVRAYGKQRAMCVDHAKDFGLTQGQFTEVVRVAELVKVRTDRLSWAHHREVARETPERQEELLQATWDKGWGLSEMRVAMRQAAKEYKDDDPGPTFPLLMSRIALDANRWLKSQPPPQEWSAGQKKEFKDKWKPLVELWNLIDAG